MVCCKGDLKDVKVGNMCKKVWRGWCDGVNEMENV